MRITIDHVKKLKAAGEKIVMLTAYDYPTARVAEGGGPIEADLRRRPRPRSIDPSKGRRQVSIKTRNVHAIQFGAAALDLSAVEQIVHWAQTRAIGAALDYARRTYVDGSLTLAEALELVLADIEREGLDVLDSRRTGDLAQFRRHELAAALNRLRTLEIEGG